MKPPNTSFDETVIRLELCATPGKVVLMLYSPAAKGSPESIKFSAIVEAYSNRFNELGILHEVRSHRSESGMEVLDSLILFLS